jgi:hypothetical protein
MTKSTRGSRTPFNLYKVDSPTVIEIMTKVTDLIEKGFISVGDDITFRTHADVLRLFGRDVKIYQRAMVAHPEEPELHIWFPALRDQDDNIWENAFGVTEVPFSSAGSLITRSIIRTCWAAPICTPESFLPKPMFSVASPTDLRVYTGSIRTCPVKQGRPHIEESRLLPRSIR